MKGQLIILVGISNSGKSKFASTTVQDNPERYVRVNRDDIRSLLYGYTDETVSEYYGRSDLNKLENQVTRYEDTLIYDGLEHGKTVIVDATHLQRKYLERFKYWNVPTEVMHFGISAVDAMARDEKRRRKVGKAVIIKQTAQYWSLLKALEDNPIDFTPIVIDMDENNVPCIVFDIDGTLAHRGSRSPFDWLKVGEDTVDKGLSEITALINLGCNEVERHSTSVRPKVIIATGRDGVSLEESEKWLEKHEIEYDEIYIRTKGDMRPDWIVKREMTEDIVKNHNILGWFDDRLQVSRHLRMLGLNVYNVAHGNF